MNVEQLPEEFVLAIVSNQSLRRYLTALNSAKGFTPESWLWDGKHGNPKADPSTVLERWLKALRSLQRGNAFEQEVYAFELPQLEKWGPQGGHPPLQEVLESHVLPTFRRGEAHRVPTAFSDPVFQQAKKLVTKRLAQLGVRDIVAGTPESVVNSVLSTEADRFLSNSGYPDFTTRKLPEVIARAVSDARSGAYKDYPAILLFRRYNGKLRMVWMFPFATNIVEAQYFQPLFDRIKSRPQLISGFFSPWQGFEGVRSIVTATYLAGEQIAASDFSSTDEHFIWATTEQVADVLEPLFEKGSREGFRESLLHMHRIPLLIGPTQWITGMHGVSSGSQWTNFVETIFDMVLAQYAELKSEGKVRGLYAIGDDMAWTTDWAKDRFNPWLEKLGASVGQEIKAEKTMLEPERVKTLQRLFQKSYVRPQDQALRGVYPTIRALKSLVYPERWHKSKSWSYDMFAVRVFMILENCVDHPLFEDFVHFVLSGSPRLYRWVRQRDEKLDSLHQEAKLIPGLVSTYNREKKESALSTFASIDVARKAGRWGVAA